MHQIKDKRFLLSTLLITWIVILSARSYMAMQEVRLNSDNAVHVLMTNDLVLPGDLYYWGQDRLGSIVPILAHWLQRLLSLPPVVAVSWSQYFFLLVGFLAFASLIKNPALRVVFALIWFLPLGELTELISISQPYGPQMAFVGLAVVIAERLTEKAETLKPFTRQMLISLLTASWFISIWISDFSVLLALIFTGVLLGSAYRQTARDPQITGLARVQLLRTDLVNIGIVSTLAIAFILFAKSQASARRSYETFSTLPQILSVISTLITSALHTLTLRAEPGQSPLAQANVSAAIHAILVGVLIVYIGRIGFSLRRQTPLPVSQWTIFFFISGIASFVVLPCIHWIYNPNQEVGINLRYFIVVYVCLWLAAILFTDGLIGSSLKGSGITGKTVKRLGLLLICTALASSWTLPSRVYALQQPPSTIEKLQPLLALGRAGFIGDYWSSYVLCTVNPDQLACTPRDRKGKIPCPPAQPNRPLRIKGVRCTRCVPKVFAADTIYLVKERWLDSFPAEISQFGQCLTKAGEPRKVAGYTLTPYKVRN